MICLLYPSSQINPHTGVMDTQLWLNWIVSSTSIKLSVSKQTVQSQSYTAIQQTLHKYVTIWTCECALPLTAGDRQ